MPGWMELLRSRARGRAGGLAGLCAVAATVAVTAAAAAPQSAALQAHRVVYALDTVRIDANARMRGADGRMAMDYAQSCEGWTGAVRFQLRMRLGDGSVVRLDTRDRSWESADGREFEFHSQESLDGAVVSEINGHAEQPAEQPAEAAAAAAGGMAVYSKPDRARRALPEAVRFPMAHTRGMIARLAAGARAFEIPVFAGDYKTPVMIYSTFRLADLAAAETAPDWRPPGGALPDSLDRPGWRLRHGVFRPEARGGTPVFELTATMLDNGVLSRFRIDYPDYSLKGRMIGYEALESPDCEAARR